MGMKISAGDNFDSVSFFRIGGDTPRLQIKLSTTYMILNGAHKKKFEDVEVKLNKDEAIAAVAAMQSMIDRM